MRGLLTGSKKFSLTKRSVWRGNWKYYLVFLVVGVLLIGFSIDFKFTTHFINGGDTFTPINPGVLIERSLSIWESGASGVVGLLRLEGLLPGIIMKFFSAAFDQPALAINLFWIGILFYLQTAFFLFYKLFVKPSWACAGTVLSIFNLFFLIFFHNPVSFQLIGLAVFPMLFYLFNRYIETSRKIFLLFFVAVHFVSFRSFNIVMFSDALIPLLSYLLYRDLPAYSKPKKYLKRTAIILGISFAACLPYLINLYFFYSSGLLVNSALVTYNQGALSINNLFGLRNVFRLSPNYGFLNMLEEEPGWVAQSFSTVFLTRSLFIFGSFIPFILTLWAVLKLKARDKKSVIVLLIFFIAILFIAKGVNPPAGEINQLLYSNQLFSSMFRSGAFYFMYFLIPLMVVIILKSHNKKILSAGMLYALLNLFVIIFLASPIHKFWNSTIPPGYAQQADLMNSHPDSNKYLVVPVANHFIGYTVYRDGYGGPDRLYTMTPKPLLTKIQATQVGEDYSTALKEIETSPELANHYFNRLGYMYIVAEKDAISSKRYTTEGYKEYTDVLDPERWHKINENENFIMYRLDPKLFPGRINATGAYVTYSQINSTQYRMHITNLKNASSLEFLESFHAGWKLYPQHPSSSDDCQPIYEYARSSECRMNQELLDKTQVGKIGDEPAFEGSHIGTAGYSNYWNLDPQHIRQNYGPQYYSENSDGSINMTIDLRFKPQAYNEISIAVSASIFLALAGVTLRDWSASKRKAKASHVK